MARRKKEEGLVVLLFNAPWWLSATLAFLVYIVGTVILPSIASDNMVSKLFIPVATNFSPILAILLAGLSGMSLIREKVQQQKTTPATSPNKQREVSEKGRPDDFFSRRESLSEGSESNGHEPLSTDKINTQLGQKPQALTLELIKVIEWKNFEQLCCAYFLEVGIKAETTGIGADGGVDINLYKKGSGSPSIIVQCKSWSSSKVGVKPVREFFGVMASEEVKKGFFIVSGDFTSDAIDFAKGKSLDLVSGERFFDLIKKLPPQSQTRLLKVATEGNYKVPSCASCDLKMVRRTKRGGGNPFWGCSNYPRCKSTIKIAVAK